MILNSTRFTVPLIADKYLNGIQLIRQELQTNRRAGYLTPPVMKGSTPSTSTWPRQAAHLRLDRRHRVLLATCKTPAARPPGFAARKLTSIFSDYGSLGLGPNSENWNQQVGGTRPRPSAIGGRDSHHYRIKISLLYWRRRRRGHAVHNISLDIT